MLAAVMVTLALSSCGVAADYVSPPSVSVTYGGETKEALAGAYDWDYRVRGNTWKTASRDSMLPVASDEEIPIFIRGEDGDVTVTFEEEPSRVRAVGYPVEHIGDFANPTIFSELQYSGGVVTVPEGIGYIVELQVGWDDTGDSYGDGYFYFQLSPQE